MWPHTYLVTTQGDQLQGLVKLKGPTSAPQSETEGSQAAPAFLLAQSQPVARSCRVSTSWETLGVRSPNSQTKTACKRPKGPWYPLKM